MLLLLWGVGKWEKRKNLRRLISYIAERFELDADTLRAPYDSVTLPERFELDAFDFGILEDVSG